MAAPDGKKNAKRARSASGKRKNGESRGTGAAKKKRKTVNHAPPHKSSKDKRGSKRKKRDVNPDARRLAVTADHLLRVGNKKCIYRFDTSSIAMDKDGKRIAIVGATGSGKTRLALELIGIHKDIPAWMIINPSEGGNHAYGPHVENEAIIHDNDNPKELVKDLLGFKRRQLKRCKQWSIPDTDPIQYDPDPSAALVIDDMAEDPKVFNDPIFGWLYCNSRNFKAWIIFLVQAAVLLPKKFRRQISHLFLFAMSSNDDIHDMWKEFASIIPFEEFKQVFLLATENHGTLVIDVAKQSNKLEEKIFYYKHKWKQPPFKVGAEWFNRQVRARYDAVWEERQDRELKEREELLLLPSVRRAVGKRKRGDTEPMIIELA